MVASREQEPYPKWCAKTRWEVRIIHCNCSDLAQVSLDALTQKGFGTSRAISGVISNTSSWVHKVVVGTEMKVEMIIKGSNNEAEGVVVTLGSRARV